MHTCRDISELLENDLGIFIGDLLLKAHLYLCHGGLGKLHRHIVGSGISLILKFHLYGIGGGYRDCIRREILGDRHYHIVPTFLKACKSFIPVRYAEVQRTVFSEVLYELFAYLKLLSFVYRSLIQIDYCYGKLIEFSVGIPHGCEE